MAQFVELWRRRRHVISLLVDAAREADEAREREYAAAVTIQSWFRGCRLRAYIQYLNECAVVIQKNFRGYVGRKIYWTRLKECVEEMQMNHYNSMATKIQRRWKGYYVRQYIFDYYAQKIYLQKLKEKNERVRERLSEHWRREERERDEREERLIELQSEIEARRHHHMLSTQCMDGVFKPFRGRKSSPLPLEQQMRSLKFYQKSSRSFGSVKRRSVSCDSHVIGDEPSQPLPPLSPPHTRVQGPFRDPEMVWRQRTRPLNPTVRAASDYNSEEVARVDLKMREWRSRVVEKPFLPFSSSVHSNQPLIHTKTPYSKLPYGTTQFRDEDSTVTRTLHNKEFRSFLPPIALFDKMNSTY